MGEYEDWERRNGDPRDHPQAGSLTDKEMLAAIEIWRIAGECHGPLVIQRDNVFGDYVGRMADLSVPLRPLEFRGPTKRSVIKQVYAEFA